MMITDTYFHGGSANPERDTLYHLFAKAGLEAFEDFLTPIPYNFA